MRDRDQFQVSSFCTGGGCLGVDVTSDGVEVADVSDDVTQPLRFTREEWGAFLAGVKAGEFDLEPAPSE